MNNIDAEKIERIVNHLIEKYNLLGGSEIAEPNIKDVFLALVLKNGIEYNEDVGYILTQDNYHTANNILKNEFERVKQNQINDMIKDSKGLSIEAWAEKYPHIYKWLLDNGFRYNPELDKNNGGENNE